MIIKNMFSKPIDRDIKGVIKVGQDDDANIKQELEEYVVTRELQKHFSDFFASYKRGITGNTDKMGVWISGFFGSGKSHFLKILSYLLENKEVGGKKAIDYFVDDNKISDQMVLADMKLAGTIPTDVVLFNIDSKSEVNGKQSKVAIVSVLQNVFNEMQGFSGSNPFLADLERKLTEEGKYNLFKEKFEDSFGSAWEESRSDFDFIQDDVVEVLDEIGFMSIEAGRNWCEKATGEYTYKVEDFARLVKKYLDKKESNHHIVFLIDEIGQYIGDDSKLMLNLQTVTEDLGTACGGKAWIIVTSQQDIDSITKTKGNDFSKIQGRFDTRLSLSSANVDEVIKKRILEKNEAGKQTLTLLYDDKATVIKNLILFNDGIEKKLYSDRENFADIYPFIPYQFNLLGSVLTSIRTHGASGKHLAEGERSMLALFKESAVKVMNDEPGTIVPFNMFYDALEQFLDHSHKGVISRALDNEYLNPNHEKECFDVNVLKTLFMIKYVKEMQEDFTKIPGMPIAYWISENTREIFSQNTLKEIASPCIGMRTGDNARFLREWYEVDDNKVGIGYSSAIDAKNSNKKWFPYNKGGAFRRWYGNNELVVNWENDGAEIKAETRRRYPMLGENLSWKISNEKFYFRKSITWSDITSAAFSGRYSDCGALFDVKGSSCFPEEKNIYYIIGLLNTKITQEIIKILNPTITTQVGDMARIPTIIDEHRKPKVEEMSSQNIELAKEDWNSFEISWDFKKHPLLCYEAGRVSIAYELWEKECENRFNQLKANEEELNRIFIDIYGLQDELTPEVEDKDVTVRKADLQRDIKSLISYAVGCMFGRYSLEREGIVYAGGNFDDVYWKYKGQAALDKNGEAIEGSYAGISLADYHYPKFHDTDDWKTATELSFEPDADNCIPITDEEYFEDDIVGLFCAWLKKVYGEDTLEENLDFIANALGNKGKTSREVIRNYFLTDFIKDHIKTYQKRPIYWLFDSGKQNGFKALVYMHRWNADTIGNVRVEYLHRIQRVYEKEITRMQEIIDNSHDNKEISNATKRKEKLQKQIKENKDYDAKIAHLALSRIDIDLDDGVKVNYEKVQTADGKKVQILAKI